MVSSATEIIFSDGFKIVASTLFGSLGLNALLEWPVAEFAIYWLVAVYSFPLFALFVTSDQTCSDKARGTLRFITLRATRSEILIGRFFGQFLIIVVLIFLTLIACIALVGWTLRVPILAATPLATPIEDDFGLGEAGVAATTMLPIVAEAFAAIPAAWVISRIGMRQWFLR